MTKGPVDRSPVKPVRAAWRDVILICRKCSKRLDGGFGTYCDQPLAKVLRKLAAQAAAESGKGGRKARRQPLGIVEVGCLDICPKKGVVAIAASRPDTWHVVPRGADPALVLRTLGVADPRVASIPRSGP